MSGSLLAFLAKDVALLRSFMSPSAKLTEQEKQNGKRRLLIPSEEIQELMQPVSREDFTRLVKKAIPPSPQPDPATK